MTYSKKINTNQLLKTPIGEFRKLYTPPCIELIVLDNEISLALQSDIPPAGPDEGNNNTPMQPNNNPFHNKMA